MNHLTQKIRHWSLYRQRLINPAEDLEQALQDVIAVYSSHPSGPLSLKARVKIFHEQDFNALETEKTALRVPAMRESAYMFPAATAFRAMRATLPPGSDPYWEKRYSQKGRALTAEYYQQWRQQILNMATRPLTIKEIKQGVDIPDEQVKPLLNRLAYAGDLLRNGSASIRSNLISYVATESWLGKPIAQMEKEAAQIWLAGEYLRAFGPARVRDFQWWAGLTLTEAETAVAAHDTINIEPGLLLLASDLSTFTSFQAVESGRVVILPQWDCYTMGYAPDGRDRFVSPEKQPAVYGKLGATGGNALGVVLIDGLVTASWKSRFKGKKMQIDLLLFDRLPQPKFEEIREQFSEIGLLLGAGTAVVDTSYL